MPQNEKKIFGKLLRHTFIIPWIEIERCNGLKACAVLVRASIRMVTLQAHLRIYGDFFFGEGVMDPLQSHSKGIYKDPNDCVNHPKLLFGSFEQCSDVRKLLPENQ